MVNRSRLSKAVGRPYVYLLLISAGFLCGYIIELFLFPVSEGVSAWLGRLATTLFGSYLAVILIDLSIRQREERERQRKKRFALQRFSGTLKGHLDMMANWLLATCEEKPDPPPESYQELFDMEYIYCMKYLDFSKEYPTSGPKSRTWLDVSGEKAESFSKSVESTLEKYSAEMDPETIETLQKLGDSAILSMCQTDIIQHDQVLGHDRDYNLLAGRNVEYYLAKHLDILLEIIKWYEQDPELELVSVGELDAWDDDVSPHAGSARLSKDPDQSEPLYGMGPTYEKENSHTFKHL